MKLRCLLILSGICWAQSITVTAPASGTISGFAYDLTVSLVSLPTATSVEYWVDDRRIVTATNSPTFTYNWSTFELWNGGHHIKAIAKDTTGSILATSAVNSFTIANGSDTIAVTPSTAPTSSWSAEVTLSVAITRGDGLNSNCFLYVDGVQHAETTDTSTPATCSFTLDTRSYENGPRLIFVQASDIGDPADHRGMWQYEVTFANSADFPVGVEPAYGEVYLIPTGTVSLSPVNIRLADGSTTVSTSALPKSDDFNRTNETPISGNWTKSEGSIKIVSNAITGNSSEANAAFFWNLDTFPVDQYAEITVAGFGAGNFMGVGARMLPNGTYYYCSWDGTTLFMGKRVNAVTTSHASGSLSPAGGNVLRIEVSGSGATVSSVCKFNGVQQLTTYADTSSDRILYGQAGVLSFRDTGTTTGDNWTGGDLAAGAGPEAIYISGNASTATVNSSGVVTGVAPGDTDITVFSRGITKSVRATVNTTNNLPHFSRTGSILTSYTAGSSTLLRSWFFSGRNALSDMTQQYRDSGANTNEEGIYLSPSDSESEVDYETRIDGHHDALDAFHASSGLYLLGIGDDMARLNVDLYKSTRGTWRTWSPDPVTGAFTRIRDSGYVVGVEMVDETSLSHGHKPRPAGLIGTDGFTSIVSDGAGNCVMNWTNYSTNGGGLFILAGATTDTDLNSAAGSLFTVGSRINANSHNFACPSVGAGTYNASSDAGLTLQMLASAWQAANTDYVRYDAFTTLMGLIDAVSNRTPITWPTAASTGVQSASAWMGDSTLSNYMSMYWAASTRRTPVGQPISDLISDMRSTYRSFYAVAQRTKPWTMITPAAGNMYKIGGTAKAVSSIASDSTLTFGVEHGVSSLLLGTTRVDISGSSALNGHFFAWSLPSSTTAKIAHDGVNQTATGFGGTATFDTAQVFTITSFQVASPNTAVLTVQDPGACQLAAQVGHSFVVAGTDQSALHRTWVFNKGGGGNPCTVTPPGGIWEVPQTASTGGTGYVITTNTYLAGRNALMVPGVHPRAVLAGFMYPILQGAAGVRTYGLSNVDPETDTTSSRHFQDEPTSGDGINYNAGPLYPGSGMQDRWNAVAAGSQAVRMLEALFLQPRAASPDYGSQFFCGARTGANGNMLACMNLTDGYQARTFDLSAYNATGSGNRWRLTEDGPVTTSFSAGTDSLTVQPGEIIIWAFTPESIRVSGGLRGSGGVRLR